MIFLVVKIVYYFGCIIFPSAVVALAALAMAMKIDIRGWPTKFVDGDVDGPLG